MRATWCAIIILVGLGCWVMRAGQQGLFLDLTTPEARQKEESRTAACGGVRGVISTPHRPQPQPELPVDLGIEWIDRKDYKIGQDIVFEVSLTNDGTSPLTIPVSQDQGAAYGKDCKWLSVLPNTRTWISVVGLLLTGPDGRSELVGSHILYGNSNDKLTYQVIPPRKSLRVRLSGKLYLPHLMEDLARKRNAVESSQYWVVSARFQLDDSSLGSPYKDVKSTNQIRVQVEAN